MLWPGLAFFLPLSLFSFLFPCLLTFFSPRLVLIPGRTFALLAATSCSPAVGTTVLAN